MAIIKKNGVLAIIIAIEKYQFNLHDVDYAHNDAEEFKKCLVDYFNINEKDIIFWIDNGATQTALKEELPYQIQHLKKDDVFYFYYAGHGFSHNGKNRLTAWDTHHANLEHTSVCLREILIDPLQKSNCNRSMIFIDACATELPKESRDVLTDMSKREFDEFAKINKYLAVFLSCSPGEKSYPSKSLEHGIWTWHLLHALKGEAREALVQEYYITNVSLQDYLRKAVPEYITKKTKINKTQTPWSEVSASGTFTIRQLPKPDFAKTICFSKLKLDLDKIYFQHIAVQDVSRLNGFNKSKGHFVPDTVNPYSTDFVQKLLKEEVEVEIKNIYDNTKKILGLQRRQIRKNIVSGGGSIDTELFRFELYVSQNPDNPGQAMIKRFIVIRCSPSELPVSFDDIFPNKIDEIVIPVEDQIIYDDIVEVFESMEKAEKGSLSEEDDTRGIIEFTLKSGTVFAIHCFDKELKIRASMKKGCFELIREVMKDFNYITGTPIRLLK